MKTIHVIAQPKAEAHWVHRFCNFGEEVYVQLRDTCEVSIDEIDASWDEFHLGPLPDDDAAAVADAVASLCRKHFLDESVALTVRDGYAKHQTVVLVFDPELGEELWEIARPHPMWIVGSPTNRAAVRSAESVNITIWSRVFLPVSEEDWRRVLDTIATHHETFDRLNVYGATATDETVRALEAFGLGRIMRTPSGFMTWKEQTPP